MKVIKYRYGDVPKSGRCVMALGFFDGVHAGHRDLLLQAKTEAQRLEVPFGIFTFESDSTIKSGVGRITSDDEKAEIFRGIGADFTVFADFPSISVLSAKDFIKEVLIGVFGTEIAVAGFNYHFGKGASGDAEMLKSEMRRLGKDAVICEKFTLLGDAVSTTRIRAALDAGKVQLAGILLGAPYSVSGVIEHGRGVGRTLGFPTLNTSAPIGRAIPRRGVYHTAIIIDGRIYSALTNVGTCPTFEEREVHLETFILDYKGNLYGDNLKIYFLDWIRDEIKFNGENELKKQITVDINSINKKLEDKLWQAIGQSLP